MRTASSGVAVVMPYLNEAGTLREACCSLGFGADGQAALGGHRLILVDNGSSDQSAAMALAVQRGCVPGAVVLVEEKVRGHVLARAAGAVAARKQECCRFIVQADADTIYGANYIEAIWKAAEQKGPGVLIDAQMNWPLESQFVDATLLQSVDRFDVTQPIGVAADVVVDDKACGFWLEDYVSWGEHFREFWSTGEEMLAETTRLYVRGRRIGARRHLAEGATAQHSLRNWITHPTLEIASGGFPMPASWRRDWPEVSPPHHCDTEEATRLQGLAFRMRERMLEAMFVLLPSLVEADQQMEKRSSGNEASASVLVEASFRKAGAFDRLTNSV